MDRNLGRNASILVYTRQEEKEYPQGLASSVHFAISRDGKYYEALNNNYGILFAKGTIGEDNTIHAKGLKKPWIFPMAQGGYGIAAVRINTDGSADEESRGKALIFTTVDFIQFSELGLLELNTDTHVNNLQCKYDNDEKRYHIIWEDAGEKYHHSISQDIRSLSSQSEEDMDFPIDGVSSVHAPQGADAGNVVEISGNLCDCIAQHWNRLTCTKITVPPQMYVNSVADVQAVQATAVFSDGSTAQKQVIWDTAGIDFSKPGIRRIHGTIKREAYNFPLTCGYGDPVIFSWEGRFYFISTNDNKKDIGLYVREASTASELFQPDTVQHLILDVDENRGLIQTFRAPEFHVIGDELYILFAVGGKVWGPQCHVMKLKKGGRIVDPADWENPIRVQRRNGNPLTEDGITLDMTCLNACGRSYMLWSYRSGIRTELDTGSMLYIAKVDPSSPWILTSEPVLLSRPLYGWENVNHTINNEGPYTFISGGRVYLTYSGGAANSYTYAVGLLTADAAADLLDISVWQKRVTPVLSYYSAKGEYGSGHNSFFTDDHGNLMIAYHAETAFNSRTRCVGIHRVHFDINNEPVFDMDIDEDWKPELANVESDAVICNS